MSHFDFVRGHTTRNLQLVERERERDFSFTSLYFMSVYFFIVIMFKLYPL